MKRAGFAMVAALLASFGLQAADAPSVTVDFAKETGKLRPELH